MKNSPLFSLLTTSLMLTITSCGRSAKDLNPVNPSVQENPGTLANPQMKAVLDKLQSLNGKPIETLDAKAARAQPTPADAVAALMIDKHISEDKEAGLHTKDSTIPGAAGPLSARIYRPAKNGKLPVVLYFHGGGFVIANKEVYDAAPRRIARELGAVVVSVDYRLAPENKFPAAHDDAFAAYRWILKNAASIGGNAARIAVAGESAGANLAINVAIKARDERIQMPLHELLVYPVAGNDLETASYRQFENAKPLNKAMMKWFFKNTLSNPQQSNDPRLNLLGEANLSDLPTTTVITAQIDPLNSEGQALARKLMDEGVATEVRNYDGVTHEFFGMASVLDTAKMAQDWAIDRLQESLF